MTHDDIAEPYMYEQLPSNTSFRVAELLPGRDHDQVTCRLRRVEWSDAPQYEAISYTWGDPNVRVPILCDGKMTHVTKNLYSALAHFRYDDRSRLMWADGLCINQENIPERGLQVKQMKRIYEHARKVQVWLGMDDQELQAETAVQSIQTISDFLCAKLGISILESTSGDDTYQEVLLRNADKLPLPNETDFSSETVWKSLVWFYSHKYFTRVWAIQEICANTNREVNIGNSKTIWNRVDLVACYIAMNSTFSDENGFSSAYCWWVATFDEMTKHPERWLNMLYLASNYSCMDPRDVVYGLRGLMKLSEGEPLLDPDYSKSTETVYRDIVEASLIDSKRTDVLLYATGNESPSWVPRWNVPMLFRNPFRFGKPMPWRPAGDTVATWSIDKDSNILILSGFFVGFVDIAESYNQLWFANGTIDSVNGKIKLKDAWSQVLRAFGKSQQDLPLSRSFLIAAATSLSFGQNQKTGLVEQLDLLRRFVAYLAIVLADDQETLTHHIPSDLIEESKSVDGRNFGKPVWDFQYPDASIYVTKTNLVGCAIATVQAGDTVFVPSGSTYPIVLRPDDSSGEQTTYTMRGFSYVHGVMHGELVGSGMADVRIR